MLGLVGLAIASAASLGGLVYCCTPEIVSARARRAWAFSLAALALIPAFLAIPNVIAGGDRPHQGPSLKAESEKKLTNGEAVSVVFTDGIPANVQAKLEAGLTLPGLEQVAREKSGVIVQIGPEGYSNSYQLSVRGLNSDNLLITGIRAHILSQQPPLGGAVLFSSPQGESLPIGIGFDLDSDDLDARVLGEHGEITGQHYLDGHFVTLNKNEIVTFNVTAATKSRSYRWQLELQMSNGDTYVVDGPDGPLLTTALGESYQPAYAWGSTDKGILCNWPDGCGAR